MPFTLKIFRTPSNIRDIRKMRILDMIRVSSTEFGKEVGRYQDAALVQPIVITRNGRDRIVVISADEYRRLKRRDREVLALEDFTEEEAEAIRRTEPSLDGDSFNHELNR